MYLSWQTLITAAAVIGAGGSILAVILGVHKWVLRQGKKSEELSELREHHEKDLARVREENTLICFALSACLDGLIQLGANHTVPLAKDKLDKYLNKTAHKQ